jgi:hypothetical protein
VSGSHRYLAALESLRELFVNYPFRAEISTITVAMDRLWRPAIMVQLHRAHPVILAAGIMEWRRTLSHGNTWAWRTPNGAELFVATAGRAPESDDMPVAVIAGPIPHDCYLENDLEPDVSEEVDDDTLYRWLGDEIANNWPFETASDTRQTDTR